MPRRIGGEREKPLRQWFVAQTFSTIARRGRYQIAAALSCAPRAWVGRQRSQKRTKYLGYQPRPQSRRERCVATPATGLEYLAGKIRLICFARLKELRRGTVIWAGREIVAVEINNRLYCKYHVI